MNQDPAKHGDPRNDHSRHRNGHSHPKQVPPALVERILATWLPKGPVGRSILGDMREEFSFNLNSGSVRKAYLAYLRTAFSVATRFIPSSEPVSSERDRKGIMESVSAALYDIGQAFRILVRKPGMAFVTVLTLGLGIGANTAIFSLVNTILLKPLPYPNSHELVEAFRIDEAITGFNPTPDRISSLFAVPYQVHQDWLDMGPVFDAGGGYAGAGVTLREGDESQSLPVLRTTSGVFQALGVPAAFGRSMLPEDDEVGATPVAVLGFGLWQTQFGGDTNVLGRQVYLNEVAHTVVGVMPPEFSFPNGMPRAWISFTDDQKTSPVRNAGYLKVIARLSPGLTIEQARREMEQVAGRIGELHPEEAHQSIGLFPQKATTIGDAGGGLWVLFGAVTLILLIACTNVAGIFLVRATERRREIGIRRALGAGRDRLVFQQMSESLILSLVGGAAGWGLATVGMDPILSLMPQELPRMEEMQIHGSLLFTSIIFALLTGILTGLFPAARAAKTPIHSVLQEGGRSLAGGRRRNRTQTGLVVCQIALAFVLLSGAGLVIRSMTSLLRVNPGFDTESLALATVSFPTGVDNWADANTYFENLEARIRGIPGVVDVGAADQMPFSGGWSSPPVTLETTEGEWEGILHLPTVTPSYLTTMDIPVVEGRGLSREDTSESEPAVVVSQSLAELMAPEGSALGLRVRVNVGDSIWRTVVGVVGDVRYRLDLPLMPLAYVPLAQDQAFVDNWVIRTNSDPRPLAGMFRELMEEMDPEGTSTYRALSEVIGESTAVVAARFSVILLGGLGALAALLAVFGVYGILAYLVQLNSREIGIQLALGANGRRVLANVLRRGLFMGGVGLGAGALMALALGRLIESQLYGIEPWDPAALATAALLLLAAAAMASAVPAARAARLDPVDVLKGD